MGAILRNFVRSLGRVFPDCVTLSQAIAFNMFLAFFPLLLLALGLLGGTSLFPDALREIPNRLVMILPPGSSRVVAEYFVRKAVHPWTWFSLGLAGTLLAGTQVMVGFMEGFRVIAGDLLRSCSRWRWAYSSCSTGSGGPATQGSGSCCRARSCPRYCGGPPILRSAGTSGKCPMMWFTAGWL